MKRGRWFGAVLGCLGGFAPAAWPQVPTERPPVVRAVSGFAPRAVLGRPVAMTPAARPGLPSPLPADVQSAPLLAPRQVTTIPAFPLPGAIIATSGKAIPTGEAYDESLHGDLFASDRRALPPAQPKVLTASSREDQPASLIPAGGPVPVPEGSWTGTFPAAPPPFAELPNAVNPGIEPVPVRFYGGLEYLLWWTRNDRAPILATTGSPDINQPFVPGSLDTRILQDGRLSRGTPSGMRFTGGWVFDECGGKAIEVSGFFLGQSSSRFSTDFNQNPVIARPFFNTTIGREDVEITSFPGQANGRLIINAPSSLWGLDANLICKACSGCGYRVSWLAGPRYLNLRESLTIIEDIDVPATANAVNLRGSRILVTDRFATSNQFYGGQVGAEARWMSGRFTLDGRLKLGLGVTQQSLTVDGSQVFLRGVNPDPRPGGLLALPSNIGQFDNAKFAFVPEVGLSFGYYLTDWMRLSVGYNLLYWSSVIRPGGQIDRNINSNQIPNFNVPVIVSTDPPPQRLFHATDYWAQGLTFGVEFNF